MKFYFSVIVLQQNAMNYISAVLRYMIYCRILTELCGLSVKALFIPFLQSWVAP